MIPAFVLKWLAARVGERFARPLAILMLLFAIIVAGWVMKGVYDRRLIANHSAAEDARTAITNSAAHNDAADQRARDTIRIAEDERNRLDAIVSAPVGVPSPAAVRLNCERLRQAGYATDGHAACR